MRLRPVVPRAPYSLSDTLFSSSRPSASAKRTTFLRRWAAAAAIAARRSRVTSMGLTTPLNTAPLSSLLLLCSSSSGLPFSSSSPSVLCMVSCSLWRWPRSRVAALTRFSLSKSTRRASTGSSLMYDLSSGGGGGSGGGCGGAAGSVRRVDLLLVLPVLLLLLPLLLLLVRLDILTSGDDDAEDTTEAAACCCCCCWDEVADDGEVFTCGGGGVSVG